MIIALINPMPTKKLLGGRLKTAFLDFFDLFEEINWNFGFDSDIPEILEISDIIDVGR